MALDKLLCASCGAPVPLVSGEQGTCPSCRASYPIPETYRALRDEAIAAARKPEALALSKALGKPPPAIIRAFAVFTSTWFIFIGLGFWLVAGLTISVRAMPWIGRHLFHVNSYDVLSENRQMQLMLLLPIGTLVIGFTLSSWARKRGIVRGGLQAALAASPPSKPYGPKVCRHCAAPLAPAPGALTARCPYCQSDNLVEMPPAWVAKMRSHASALTTEVKKAAKQWADERRTLRRSLIKRFVLWTVFLLLPLWFIFGAAAGGSSSYALPYEHADGPPVDLPPWSKDVAGGRSIEIFKCESADQGFQYKPKCARGRCAIYVLIALRHGEVVRHAAEVPDGSKIDLQIHDRTWLDDRWLTVDSAPISDGHEATTRTPYSGWYRFRLTVPGNDTSPHHYCATVNR